ncbi:hypothetical protein ABPG77_006896 [Micractinium sp. CCAP 211/92]
MELRGGMMVLWLGLAVLAQICVAVFGVFSRSLQTKADPPIPALRLLFLVSLLALAFLAVLDALSWAVAAMQRWRRQQRTAVATPGKGQREQADDIETGSVVGLPEASPQKEGGASTGGSAAKLDKAACSEGATAADDAAAAAAVERRAARPEVPLERGLSRKLRGLEQRHPTAHRWLACLSIAVSMALAGGAQVVAPGMVDAAIVQLVNTFGVLLVVFVQAFLLGHRLPLLVYPCAGLTVAGAAMVIVPSIGKGGRGGLDSGRAWLGFGLSVVSMLAASSMYLLLQAFRRLKLSGTNLQYLYLSLTLLVAFPLTMAVDGTDWAAGFGPWDAGNWAELVASGTVIYVGQNYLLQHTTWQLGAPLVSMLYGLRLVASILLSKAILSYTVIDSAVQIAGAVLTVSAVTAYMGHRWWASQQQQTAALRAQDSAPTADFASTKGREASSAVAECGPAADSQPKGSDASAKGTSVGKP